MQIADKSHDINSRLGVALKILWLTSIFIRVNLSLWSLLFCNIMEGFVSLDKLYICIDMIKPLYCNQWGKARVVLSQYLFAVYLDELSIQLGSARVGCTVGNMVVNHLAFADDICHMCIQPQYKRTVMSSEYLWRLLCCWTRNHFWLQQKSCCCCFFCSKKYKLVCSKQTQRHFWLVLPCSKKHSVSCILHANVCLPSVVPINTDYEALTCYL